jgi:hypothetical protein
MFRSFRKGTLVLGEKRKVSLGGVETLLIADNRNTRVKIGKKMNGFRSVCILARGGGTGTVASLLEEFIAPALVTLFGVYVP